MSQQQGIGLVGLVSKHPGRNRGGVAVSIRRLSSGLVAQGVGVQLFMSQPEGEHFLLSQLPEAVDVAFLPRGAKWRLVLKLWRQLRRTRPACLLAFDSRAAEIAVAASRLPGVRLPVYVTLRNPLATPDHQGHISWRRRTRRRWQRLARRLAGISTVSQGQGDQVAQLLSYPREDIAVIPNGIIEQSFLEQAVAAPEHPWLQDDGPPVIVCVARLEEQKDLPTLLQAFALLRQQQSARLLVLGEGRQRGRLEALVAQLDLNAHVAMPGFVCPVGPYLRCASLVALSSRWEGFGNVLVEALTLGTPIVSTDCPFGPRDIVAQTGCGRLAPVGDSQALAREMAAALAAGQQEVPPAAALLPYQLPVCAREYLRFTGMLPEASS